MKTPKEYLQEKYPVMKEHWNQHETINDEWVAQMMQEYAESYHAQFEGECEWGDGWKDCGGYTKQTGDGKYCADCSRKIKRT